MEWKRFGLAAVGLLLAFAAHAVDVTRYARNDEFRDMKLSPDGEYFAATVPFDDRTVLVTIRRSDRQVAGTFRLGAGIHVDEFWWVGPDRLLISVAEQFGSLDEPIGTGELFTMKADGSDSEILVGARVDAMETGTRLGGRKSEAVAAWLLDDLPDNDHEVLVTVQPFIRDAYTQVDRMDVRSGKRYRVVRAPIPNATFYTDNAGQVRFALGVAGDNVRKLYRLENGDDWSVVASDEDGRIEWPLGFSADNRTVYLEAEQPSGPNRVVAWNLEDGSRREVLADDDTDPARPLQGTQGETIGAVFMDGRPRMLFLDDKSPDARVLRMLAGAFPGQAVDITSRTRDGRLLLVSVSSDVNPGDFYLFDTVARKADLVQSRRHWFDPARMSPMEPIVLKARDGLPLHGYLTRPRGSQGPLPLVVMPHGGPFGVQDSWGFSQDVQMLAEAGYAVLQVNFRGSSGYGRSFMVSGARQWGRAMQDDVTDATRWAIEQGIARPDRICIYGASYGAYAALTGAAKEPGLYRCAAGYVGVYDLPMMQREDARLSRRISTWSKDWVGEGIMLESASPTRMADRITVPVFLAAGGKDEVAPIRHSRMMEEALRKSGTPVETLYVDTEGHGFYEPKHREAFYSKLLAFLSTHLGGAGASAATGSEDSAGR